jgi:hypothetical protein
LLAAAAKQPHEQPAIAALLPHWRKRDERPAGLQQMCFESGLKADQLRDVVEVEAFLASASRDHEGSCRRLPDDDPVIGARE